MTSSDGDRGIHFSLRELLVTIAFVAVAFAALKFANVGWWLAVSSAALLFAVAMTIVAIVDRGPRRAFAVGFISCAAMYGLLMYLSTSKLLFEHVV